jgi:transcription antitermination factor NusG
LESEPLDFFEGDSPLQLIVTVPRHEKLVATALEQYGIPFYLPLINKVRKYKKGRAVSELPLFSTYIFTHHPGVKKECLFGITRHLRSMIDVSGSDREQLICDLQSLKTVLDSQRPIEPCDELQLGQKVKIRRGAMKDLEGVIVQKRGSLRFVVNVHFLGRSVQTELDPADLKAELE